MTSTQSRKPGGRPSKLTPAIRRRFLEIVASGVASSRAARAVGVCPETVANWTQAHPDFAEELEASRERCLASLERRVHEAAQDDWRAACWLLERKLPGEYGRRDRIEAKHEISLEALLQLARERESVERPAPAPSEQAKPAAGSPEQASDSAPGKALENAGKQVLATLTGRAVYVEDLLGMARNGG